MKNVNEKEGKGSEEMEKWRNGGKWGKWGKWGGIWVGVCFGRKESTRFDCTDKGKIKATSRKNRGNIFMWIRIHYA